MANDNLPTQCPTCGSRKFRIVMLKSPDGATLGHRLECYVCDGRDKLVERIDALEERVARLEGAA